MLHTKFDFNDLFIFDLANNHQGSVEHGLRIASELAQVAKAADIRSAIKLQFRQLDSLIHPAHRNQSDNKHIPRFLSTQLTKDQFCLLITEIKKQGLLTMATPFDEASVDLAEKLGVEIIKIGSCSANDWPLLERIAETVKPVICSTGGLSIPDVDKIASFFAHRRVHFALMHCVGLYPTPKEKLYLNRIEVFRKRYPGIVIGFSTHEEPNNIDAIQIAYAKGARIFEKHAAIPTEEFKINAYSATPNEIATWIGRWKEARAMCGPKDSLSLQQDEEILSLRSLMRGVYAHRPLKIGTPLKREYIYFAMPALPEQLVSGEWKDYLVTERDYQAHEAISQVTTQTHPIPKKFTIGHIVHELKGMLNSANIAVGPSPDLELSHHYGLDRFREWGAAIIDCINREYCKKIIIQLAGQKHPLHFHKTKEEAFQVLQGELIAEIEGRERVLYPGDVVVVPRAAWHGFKTKTGVIFEEISTTHSNDDSFYEDKNINKTPRENRKTKLMNWGNEQFGKDADVSN